MELAMKIAMEIVEKLPMELFDRVFSYLSVRDLCSFGALNKHWRERINQNHLWIKRCKLRGWSKFGDENDPACILEDSSSTSSMFGHPSANNCIRPQNPSLSKLCKWKEVFMKVNHLNGNWSSGRHVVHSRKQVSAFDCNGSVLLMGSQHGCLLLCSLLTPTTIHRHELGVSLGIRKIKIYKDSAAIGCRDGSIRVFKIEAELLVQTILFHGEERIYHLGFQGVLIVCACGEGDLTVWSLSQSTHLHHLNGHTDEVTCLSMLDDRVVTGSRDRTLIIWNAALGVLLKHLRGHTDIVTSCQFDQEKVYSSSYDDTVRVWKIATGECLMELKNDHSILVNLFYCVTFNDRFIAAGTRGGEICVWNSNGQDLRILDRHSDMVQHLQMKDGRLVSVGSACEAIVWDLGSGRDLNIVHSLIIFSNSWDGYHVFNRFKFTPYSSMWMNETMLIMLSSFDPFKLTVIDYWGDVIS